MNDFYAPQQAPQGFQSYGEGFAPTPPAPPAPPQQFMPVTQAIAQSVSAPAPTGFAPAPTGFSQAPAPQAPAPQPSYGGGGGGYGGGGGGSSYGGGNSYGSQRPSNGYGGGGGRPGGQRSFGKPPLTPQQIEALKLPKFAVLSGNYNAQDHIRPLVAEAVDMLKRAGYIIRTSSGKGFDDIALQTVGGHEAEIYLPCKFNDFNFTPHSTFNGDECKEFTRRHCPDFGSIPEKQQMWYYRNTRLVLGKNCTQPAQVSIIWSDDGVESAGNRTPKSGHAGHVAVLSRIMGIPVFNLNNPGATQRLKQFLEG